MCEWLLLAIVLNFLLPAGIFVAWLVAEFRWQRRTRILLGLAWMVYLIVPMCLPATSRAEILASRHRGALLRIGILLEHEREPQVRRALRAYEESFDSSPDESEALRRMESVLCETTRDSRIEKADSRQFRENEKEKVNENEKVNDGMASGGGPP